MSILHGYKCKCYRYVESKRLSYKAVSWMLTLFVPIPTKLGTWIAITFVVNYNSWFCPKTQYIFNIYFSIRHCSSCEQYFSFFTLFLSSVSFIYQNVSSLIDWCWKKLIGQSISTFEMVLCFFVIRLSACINIHIYCCRLQCNMKGKTCAKWEDCLTFFLGGEHSWMVKDDRGPGQASQSLIRCFGVA